MNVDPHQILVNPANGIEYVVDSVISTTSGGFVCTASTSDTKVVLKGSSQRKSFMEGVHHSIVNMTVSSTAVVRLLDRFRLGPVHINVSEWCEGGDLYEAIVVWTRCGRMDPKRKVHIAIQVFAAIVSVLLELQTSTEKWVHRDIKPENILLRRRPDDPMDLRMMDFALCDFEFLAMQSLVCRTAGTTFFLPPECFTNPMKRTETKLESIAHSSMDVWSLGIMVVDILDHSSTDSPAPATNKPVDMLLQEKDSFSKTASLIAECLPLMLMTKPEDRLPVSRLSSILEQYLLDSALLGRSIDL